LSATLSVDFHATTVFNLQIVQVIAPLLISLTEPVDFVLIISDLGKKLGVGLLSR